MVTQGSLQAWKRHCRHLLLRNPLKGQTLSLRPHLGPPCLQEPLLRQFLIVTSQPWASPRFPLKCPFPTISATDFMYFHTIFCNVFSLFWLPICNTRAGCYLKGAEKKELVGVNTTVTAMWRGHGARRPWGAPLHRERTDKAGRQTQGVHAGAAESTVKVSRKREKKNGPGQGFIKAIMKVKPSERKTTAKLTLKPLSEEGDLAEGKEFEF